MVAMTNLAVGESRLAAETRELVEMLRSSLVLVTDGGRGSGSGVIWSSDGTIVTNHHVAPGQRAEVMLADGRRYAATAQASNPARDLAILGIQANGLPAAQHGDSDQLRVGQLVFAAGNPLGLRGAVTFGIISGLPAGDRGMVQADITLAPGNSGGMLATADGCVVGITSMVYGPGLALAVPSNAVLELIASKGSYRAYLGVTLTELPPQSRRYKLSEDGRGQVMIVGVAPDGPSAAAGLLPGDRIVSIGGQGTDTLHSVSRRLDTLRAGESVNLELYRAGGQIEISVVVGEAREEAA